ncbi:disulfide bond formation protein B [Pseudomonas sp. NPDC007930]|uniref:disulfide bond formation protein B n=1 Tax=Pseudomonas sp. NPDC007930 TaxID=3364417 RepID=UPI0036EE08AA
MLLAPVRLLFMAAFLISAGALAAAYAVQTWAYLTPCALCYTQRAWLAAAAVLSLLGIWLAPRAVLGRAFALALLGCCGAGAAAALRQLWLQTQVEPAQALDLLNADNGTRLHALPHSLAAYVLGTPDCGLVNWSFLGLSLPEWSLLNFCLLAALSAGAILRR